MKPLLNLSLLAIASTNLMFGSLISVGLVPSTGDGLGTVNTLLTIQSPGSTTNETGCVGAGTGGTEVTGTTKCPAGFTGGNEQAINNIYTAAGLGFTTFADIQLIFNPAEPGGNSVQLDSLALTLWDPADGTLLGAFYTAGPILYMNSDHGTGNAGFGFEFDAAQAAQADAILAAFPNLYIGGAANASLAENGQETIFIRTINGPVIPPNEVPEPSTYAVVGAALILVGYLRRKM